jgi:hypothetical protein
MAGRIGITCKNGQVVIIKKKEDFKLFVEPKNK